MTCRVVQSPNLNSLSMQKCMHGRYQVATPKLAKECLHGIGSMVRTQGGTLNLTGLGAHEA
jgi:hypothetical protein